MYILIIQYTFNLSSNLPLFLFGGLIRGSFLFNQFNKDHWDQSLTDVKLGVSFLK